MLLARAVADQDVVVEGSLHVLVGRREVDRVAALDRVDPGLVPGEGDVEQARVRLGLGEGGVVAAGPADDRAAGAAAAGGEQVAVGAAVEVGRAGQAADQAVGAGAAVEVVGAEAGLDQVVLGAAVDRVVAEPAGEPDVLDRGQRAFDAEVVVAGAEVGHQPAGRAAVEQVTWSATDPGAAGADRDPFAGGDAEARGERSKATVKSSWPPPPTIARPPPPPGVESSST